MSPLIPSVCGRLVRYQLAKLNNAVRFRADAPSFDGSTEGSAHLLLDATAEDRQTNRSNAEASWVSRYQSRPVESLSPSQPPRNHTRFGNRFYNYQFTPLSEKARCNGPSASSNCFEKTAFIRINNYAERGTRTCLDKTENRRSGPVCR